MCIFFYKRNACTHHLILLSTTCMHIFFYLVEIWKFLIRLKFVWCYTLWLIAKGFVTCTNKGFDDFSYQNWMQEFKYVNWQKVWCPLCLAEYLFFKPQPNCIIELYISRDWCIHVYIPVYRSWIIWFLTFIIFRQRVRSLNTKRNIRKRKRVTKRRSIQCLTVRPMQTVKVTATHPCLTRNCYKGWYCKPIARKFCKVHESLVVMNISRLEPVITLRL